MTTNRMNPVTRKVLDFIDKHPSVTMNQIADIAQENKEHVSSALYTLWKGRYVTRVKGEKRGESGLKLFEYTLKSATPRKKPRKNHTPEAPAISSEVELMIAIKGTKETTVLTLDQARALMAQLKLLGM